MGRKAANHKHVKGMGGKRICNNPCMHRRKGTSRKACRKNKKYEEDLTARMKNWAANKKAAKDFKANWDANKKAASDFKANFKM